MRFDVERISTDERGAVHLILKGGRVLSVQRINGGYSALSLGNYYQNIEAPHTIEPSQYRKEIKTGTAGIAF